MISALKRITLRRFLVGSFVSLPILSFLVIIGSIHGWTGVLFAAVALVYVAFFLICTLCGLFMLGL